jgi:hypothetical protein
MSSGLVSRIIKAPLTAASALFLIDARCLPGAEGAPVFSAAGELIGMVAPTLKIQTCGDQGSKGDKGSDTGNDMAAQSGRDWIESLSKENQKTSGSGDSPYNMDEEVQWEEVQMDIVMPVASFLHLLKGMEATYFTTALVAPAAHGRL